MADARYRCEGGGVWDASTRAGDQASVVVTRACVACGGQFEPDEPTGRRCPSCRSVGGEAPDG